MQDTQITLVQESFAKVVPISDQAGMIFYDRLFEIAPEVRPYFKGDMVEQGKKLMSTLGMIVNGLRNLEKVVPAAQAMAIKHVEYGVKAEDYAKVGAALLFTLDKGLGEAFDPETEAAWITAYTTLSNLMIETAYPAATE